MKWLSVFKWAVWLVVLTLAACSNSKKQQVSAEESPSVPIVEQPKPAEIPELPASAPEETRTDKADTSEVSFLAIGDVLFHTPLFKACKEDSAFCHFEYVFAPWEKDIAAADIAVVNQETIFVPRSDGYASYPSFGSPEEVGLAEIAAGFDLVTHATNHTIDRGEKAVDYTIAFWKDKPAKALGIHATEADRDSVFVLDKKGIRFAFVNFTYGLNGQKLPADRPYLVDLLDSGNLWLKQIQRADSLAEVTVAFLHFGTEYVELPSPEAMRQAELAIDAGADIVVGTHPHVIEPYGVYTTKSGNRALVYWSLGNFVSNQQQLETNLGGVAKFTVRKIQTADSSKIEITQALFEGSVTQQEVGNYHAVPLSAYSDSLSQRHLLKAKVPAFNLENLQARFQKNLENAKNCQTEDPAGHLPLAIGNPSFKK